MVAVPQQQQTLKASAGSAHITVSGGVFTQQFIEALMQPVASHAAVQAEAFALGKDAKLA